MSPALLAVTARDLALVVYTSVISIGLTVLLGVVGCWVVIRLARWYSRDPDR